MADDRLRELERRWKESGDPQAQGAYLLERVRLGELRRERLELAAACGHAAAAAALGRGPASSSATDWWGDLAARDPDVRVAAELCLAGAALRATGGRDPELEALLHAAWRARGADAPALVVDAVRVWSSAFAQVEQARTWAAQAAATAVMSAALRWGAPNPSAAAGVNLAEHARLRAAASRNGTVVRVIAAFAALRGEASGVGGRLVAAVQPALARWALEEDTELDELIGLVERAASAG